MKSILPSPFFRDISGQISFKELQDDGTVSICLHEDILFLRYNGLFMLSSEGSFFTDSVQLNWNKIRPIPFRGRFGQSMTSTPFGLAFFGGRDENNCFYNDLWLYHQKEWFYVTCNVPERAFHSACWDGQNFLVINGGVSHVQLSSEFFLVNLQSQETFRIDLGFNKVLSHHSMTQYSSYEIVLFGGKDSMNTVCGDIYFVNLSMKSVNLVSTDFKECYHHSHNSAMIYRMLMVSGGFNNSMRHDLVWAFNFDHKIWIPFKFVESTEFVPLLCYTSTALTQNRGIHIINSKLNQIYTFPVFAETPPKEYSDHPQYIHFLRTQVSKSIGTFNQFQEKLIRDSSSYTSIGTIRDVFEQLYQSKKKLKSFKKSVDVFPEISQYNSSKNKYNLNPVHEIVSEIQLTRARSEIELPMLSKEAKELSKLIEANTFRLQICNDLNLQSVSIPNTIDFESLSSLSLQLAQQINVSQNELQGIESKYYTEKSTLKQRKDTLLILQDHYCSICEKLEKSKASLHNVKKQCILTAIKLIEIRKKLILSNEKGILKDNEIEHIVEEFEKPSLISKIDDLLCRKKSLFIEMGSFVDALILEKDISVDHKLEQIISSLEAIDDWTSESNRIIGDSSFGSLDLEGYISKQSKQLQNSPSQLIHSLYQWDSLTNDFCPIVSLFERTKK